MDWRYAILANPHGQGAGLPSAVLEALTALGAATYQLAISCEECNAGGHTCPGDGDHIPHGAANCGKHDETRPYCARCTGLHDPTEHDEISIPIVAGTYEIEINHEPTALAIAAGVCVCSRTEKMYCAAPGCHGGADVDPVLIWVERTWADVRIGDRVRLPKSDAPPALVTSCMHQRWHVDPRSSEYRPEALEWSAVHVTLTPMGETDDGSSRGPYDMDPAKPVEIEIDEATFHMLNALGWENRVGMITS